jgi:hypothetical protein
MKQTDTKDLVVALKRAASTGDRYDRLIMLKAAARLEQLQAVVDKLPKTADGLPVVPNADPIWIDPEHNGWIGEDPFIRQYDENDEAIRAKPIRIDTWVAHKGIDGTIDHLWLVCPGCEEGDHWEGPFFSTESAALAAKSNSNTD